MGSQRRSRKSRRESRRSDGSETPIGKSGYPEATEVDVGPPLEDRIQIVHQLENHLAKQKQTVREIEWDVLGLEEKMRAKEKEWTSLSEAYRAAPAHIKVH